MDWLRENVFPDAVDKQVTEVAVKTHSSGLPAENGWDRVKRVFQRDEFQDLSPEANMILQAGAMSLFVGGVYGGFNSSKGAYLNFMKFNDATVFKDHLDAKKKLQDAVTKSFGRGAFRWGWRLSLFSTSYVGISTLISVYRGKGGIIEHVVAGATTGFMYKFQGGPTAMVVGGGLGLVLGTLAGCCSYGLMRLSGMSMDDVRYWNYQWKKNRSQHFKEAVAKDNEGELPHLALRNEILDDKGIDLNVLPNENKT